MTTEPQLDELFRGLESEQRLKDFVAYCLANPKLRFWQALRNWSEFSFVLAVREGDEPPYDLETMQRFPSWAVDTYYCDFPLNKKKRINRDHGTP